MRSARPAAETYSLATSHIAGSSMIVQRSCGIRCASAMQKQPEPPPTSSNRRTPEKSTLRAIPKAAAIEWLCMKAAITRACSISTCPAAHASLGRSPGAPVVEARSPLSASLIAAWCGEEGPILLSSAAPVVGAAAQQVETRDVGELIAAVIPAQQAQRCKEREDDFRGPFAEFQPACQLLVGGRRGGERFEHVEFDCGRHRRQRGTSTTTGPTPDGRRWSGDPSSWGGAPA